MNRDVSTTGRNHFVKLQSNALWHQNNLLRCFHNRIKYITHSLGLIFVQANEHEVSFSSMQLKGSYMSCCANVYVFPDEKKDLVGSH